MTDGSRRLEPGRAAFNRGAYFEAHELWEEAWRELEGPERIFVQGLIQIAAGLHHLERNRPRPAAGLLRKGLDKLSHRLRDPERPGASHEPSPRLDPEPHGARASAVVHGSAAAPALAPFAELGVDDLARDVARVLSALDEPGATTLPDTTTLKL